MYGFYFLNHTVLNCHCLFQPKGQGPVRLTQSTADDYVIDLLAQCEQKLMKLMEDLDGKDVSELYSGMEDEEVSLVL